MLVVVVVGWLVLRSGSDEGASSGGGAPVTVPELVNSGLAAYSAGDLPGAQALFIRALKLEPKNPRVLYNLGVVAGRIGDDAGARSLYRRAVAADPSFADAFYNLGVVEAKLGSDAAAVKAYAKVLEFQPDNLNAKWNLGLLLYALGKQSQARDLLKGVIAVDPAFASRLPADVELAG